jgi:flavin-dependent dehydrogenase
VGSVIRRALGVPRGPFNAQVIEVDTEWADPDVPADVIHFDATDRGLRGYAWDFPTLVDGQSLVCRGVYELRPDQTHGADGPDVGERLSAYLARRGLDPTRYRRKRFAERGLSPSDPMSRPRVLLVGEAAGIDPLTGEGIAQAIEYGELAGQYLASALRGGDLEFADWPATVTASSLGRNLWLRRTVSAWFYGALRPHTESFLAACPDALELGLQSFAGDRLSRPAIARAFVRLCGHALRALPALLQAAASPRALAPPP